MVRYSTGLKILSVLDDWAWFNLGSDGYVKAVELQKTIDSLVSKLKEEAVGGDGVRKYARGNVNYDGNELALYVAVQCTPDLSKGDCAKCLSKASTEIRSCCTGKPLFFGTVMSTNCYLVYQHTSFFYPPSKFNDKECG
ncbi:hypothetical protein L1987_51486 [Smallanthus sonchifolius]|uniref:Uncharacterized protein n=1 Tax=Smallanthus sonchifolius TaxID=185202 RepID=A0ACB9EPX5_9ASTR|nr:hypothetical protein L1987_51486 [Smallanthus sonchifolius]